MNVKALFIVLKCKTMNERYQKRMIEYSVEYDLPNSLVWYGDKQHPKQASSNRAPQITHRRNFVSWSAGLNLYQEGWGGMWIKKLPTRLQKTPLQKTHP